MKLSKNFNLDEFTKSQTATRKGINNDPSPEVVENLKALVENVLQPLRDHYNTGLKISSGYRCKELNKAVGGASNSQHLTGEASDISAPGHTILELFEWCKVNVTYDQLILEFHDFKLPESGWVHISYTTKGKNRKQILEIGCKNKSASIK